MTRRHFSTTARLAIFNAAKGLCHICGGKIESGQAWELDHVNELWLSDDDSDENMKPAHKKCHRAKTSARATVLAKVARIEAKHKGVKKQSKWGPFRRKMDGTVIDTRKERE